jgi:hypothetical protein
LLCPEATARKIGRDTYPSTEGPVIIFLTDRTRVV